jgi:Lipoprotein LpqB beta-propeller domain/Sporulation and spore germination
VIKTSKLMRYLGAAIVAALSTALTSGCAQLPTSGLVQQGNDLSAGIAGDYLYYSPSGPTLGATQTELIRGFLNAGTAPQNDFSTAREFLSRDFKSKWDPNGETLVQRGQLKIEAIAENQMVVSVGVQSQVDADGQFSYWPAGYARQLDFVLVREGNEWRIDSAPNLIVVIQPVFDVIFSPYSLYFYDNAYEQLVPDVRWFPSRASTTTLIVNAVLNGPAEWLRDGVKSAIPEGSKLSIDSVAVESGVAKIDLNSAALRATASERRLMKAQLVATLGQIAGVSDVQISVERTPQDIVDLPPIDSVSNNETPIGLSNNQLRHIGGSRAAVRNSSYSLNRVSPTGFALTSDESRLALRGEGGIWIAQLDSIGQAINLIDSRSGLLNPVFDVNGALWSTGASSKSALFTYSIDGAARQIESPWLASIKRKQFAISPEGSRIAFLESRKSGNVLWVAAIVRNTDGEPVGLGNPIEIDSVGAAVSSFAWANETKIAVLANDATGTVPKLLQVGGLSRSLPAVENAVEIAASNKGDSIYIRNIDGDVFQLRGNSWSLVAQDQSYIQFAG